MCGIAGIYRLKTDARPDRETLNAMINRITYRGPDELAMHVEPRAGLAACRLAIMDPADGHQPMRDEGRGLACVCNGEIFNFRTLRHDLEQRGFSFRTNCDVETILPLYAAHGINAVSRLDGQFAYQ